MRELSFFDRGVYILNLICGALLLLSCLAPYISVKTFLPLAFLSLFFPLIFIINIPFIFYWSFRKKKIFILSLSAVLISYFTFGSFYRFGSSNIYPEDKDLSIMTYNTRGFNFKGWSNFKLIRNKIIDFVDEQDPDIICFQESKWLDMRRLKNYPFKYITPYTSQKSIQAILSKYPIVANGTLEFPDTANNAIYADIEYKGDTIRIYNLHLQSYQIRPSSVRNVRRAVSSFNKMRRTFVKQEEQVQIFNNHKKKSPFRTIVCADFNNTPFSNVYRIAKGEMRDTFDEKGTGFGKTFDIKVVPFRIDFILGDKTMQVMTHQNFDLKLSDHYPVLTSIRL
ncbi:MAG: endonuclease/exonuclease/phosphatase family protein [Eudoraea sp.]|uniref:endonuclease/exonuclease/phosphatase family protein n=1 Tax=Eudoraea sp. TaxID=1979955 RepID=UPI0032672C01